MKLSRHDLAQMDDEYLDSLNPVELRSVSGRLRNDLVEALDRLKQNPSNSSRPPSSREPWITAELEGEEEDEDDTRLSEEDASEGDKNGQSPSTEEAPEDTQETPNGEEAHSGSNARRKPGRQVGAQGHGRTQTLPVTGEIIHRAEACTACERELGEEDRFLAHTGYYVIDIEVGEQAQPGLRVSHTKHLYGDTICACGHATRTLPHRCEKEPDWDVELTEWRLVGPMLAALIICLAKRMRLSRSRIRELLKDWLHLHLSVGTLNQCLHEGGRAAAPVEEQIIEEVHQSGLLNVDETSWKERAKALWLWVFVTATSVLFRIGSRSRENVEAVLGRAFSGWLMSDGYRVYRYYLKRLRCWDHLKRKAQGLCESLSQEANRFGKEAREVLKTLRTAVYEARAAPGQESLLEHYEKLLANFKATCEVFAHSPHEKTRALAREFLNDWEAIFRVLAHPELPLTNNEAERALRHWVIARRISYGTRTPQGSRAFAVLASVIETCRKRDVSPWPYLAQVIAARRKGLAVPPLPAPA